MLLENVEVEHGTSRIRRRMHLVSQDLVEVNEIVHLKKIIKVHLATVVLAGIDIIDSLSELHGRIRWKEGVPEHAVC